MWVFISARLRQWLIFAIAVPVLTLLVRLVRQTIEKRSGQNAFTRALARVENLGRRKKR